MILFMKTFIAKLEQLCERHKVSRKDLAEAANVSKSTVNNWFTGRALPTIDTGTAIAERLGVSLDYLANDRIDEPTTRARYTERVEEFVELFGESELLRRLYGVQMQNAPVTHYGGDGSEMNIVAKNEPSKSSPSIGKTRAG